MQDTDSLVFWLAEKELRDCVRPELLSKFDEEKKFIFEDFAPAGQLPHSRLKLEGSFRRGWFRSMKSYYLANDDEKPVLRAKGVTRLVQSSLSEKHFEINEKDQFYFTNYALRPAPSNEMTLGKYTRKNATCLNYKRRMHDNLVQTFPLD